MTDSIDNYSILTLGEVLAVAPDRLLEKADEISLPNCKYLASYYPDARVRRAFLQRIGVVFSDDSSYANLGFTVVPNSPSARMSQLPLTLSVFAIVVQIMVLQ